MLRTSASRTAEFDGKLAEKHLLVIEQQALIQVILEKYAEAKIAGRSDFMRAHLNIDSLLSEASSSDVISQHGTVLAMHLMKYGKNLSKFRQHIEQLHGDGIACLEVQHEAVRKHVGASEKPSLFVKKQYAQLFGHYQKVCDVMEALRSSKTATDTDRLTHKLLHGMPEKWHVSSLCLQPGGASLKRSDCLKMLMWLAAYYEFYLKKRQFPVLIDKLRENMCKGNMCKKNMCFEHTEIKLFEILLLPNALLDTSGTILQPIFHPASRNSQDQTEAEMRDCIVNVIAVIFGSPPKSNHLWYHLMQPKDLNETFMTGFMYQAPVSSKNGLYYQDGIHLTENGTYGKYAYTADGGKRALTLPSLYVLLWINFAALGMALYTKTTTTNDTSFLCDGKSPETFSSECLSTLWKHMTVNMDICDEHITHLVTDCLWGMLKISCKGDGSTGGIFKTCNDLTMYEKMWQEEIFEPAYSSLSREICTQLEESSLMRDVTSMKTRYPKQLTYDRLAYMLQATPKVQEEIKLLSQFILEYPRFHVGSSLLTDLIRFYQWLHRELAHTMTKVTARKLTVTKLHKELSKNCPEKLEEYEMLFKCVEEKYNKYVSLTGRHKGVKAKQHHLQSKSVVVDLLSDIPSEAVGKDCLFTVIDDIISSHRHILECLSQSASSSNGLQQYATTEYETLPPTLISPSECIINQEEPGNETASLKILMRKWSCYLHSSHGPDDGMLRLGDHHMAQTMFNALRLQEDVVATYLAGKAMIDKASCLHTPFSFVSSESTCKKYPNPELEHFSRHLPSKFKVSMNAPQLGIMEHEFHSTDFEAYQGIISFLTTAVCILVNVLQNEDKNHADLEKLSLRPFLQTEQEAEDLFAIEIKRYRFTKAQVKYLEEIQLCYLFSTLLIFTEWNREGVYDFHMLPFAMKGKMHVEDCKAVESIQHSYQDHKAEFLRDLKLLEAALVHLQSQIIKIVDENPQIPISSLIDKNQNPLARHIPDSVSIHHYVSLRIILRRLMLSIQPSKARNEDSDDLSEKWQEWDSNPWQTHLRCSMQSSQSVLFSVPDLGNFGFTARDVTAIEQMGETFECHSDTVSESTTALHQEYMSDLKSLEMMDDTMPMEYPDLQIIPGKSMVHYDGDEVCKFLEAIGLSQCVEWAKSEEITGDLLVEESGKVLTDENLSGLGLDNSFHRLKLLVCLGRQATGISDIAKEYPPTKVIEFLSTMGREFEDYIKAVEENGLDGEMLYHASEEALKDLGIKKAVHRAKIMHNFCSKINGQSHLSVQFPPEKVSKVLLKMNLEASITFVMHHGIDGDIVSKASDDLLREMGVKTKGQMRKLRGEFKET